MNQQHLLSAMTSFSNQNPQGQAQGPSAGAATGALGLGQQPGGTGAAPLDPL